MSGWMRVDTSFPNHPKVLDIGPLGECLWLRGLCYAGEHLTDGFVPASYLKRMGDMKALAVAERLVDAGLWQETDGGYLIHGYLDWQRSKDEVADLSSKRAESGRRGGKQRASNLLATSQASAKQTPSKNVADTDTDTDTEQTEANASVPPKPPRGERVRTTKTAVPDDLDIPVDEWQRMGREQRMSDADLRRETEAMKDHFRAKGERRVDWVATWRNWMRSPYRKSTPVSEADRIYQAFVNGAGEPPRMDTR